MKGVAEKTRARMERIRAIRTVLGYLRLFMRGASRNSSEEEILQELCEKLREELNSLINRES